jgi:hypothetical protein
MPQRTVRMLVILDHRLAGRSPTPRCLPMANSLRPRGTELQVPGKSSFAALLHKARPRRCGASIPSRRLVSSSTSARSRPGPVRFSMPGSVLSVPPSWLAGHRRQVPDSLPMAQRAVQALPAPQQSTAALPAPERRAELHLQFHGLTNEEAAAIVRRAIADDSAHARPVPGPAHRKVSWPAPRRRPRSCRL